MEIQGYKIHPLAQKVPEMTGSEYRQLKESLLKTGQTSPIIRYQDEIIDGRHRLKACLELGFVPWIKEYDGDKPVAQYILSTNIRRNLTKLQRHQMIADFASEIIPQVDAEIGQGKRTDLLLSNSTEVKCITPGRKMFAEKTGATMSESLLVKSIHDKAPELLLEVAQRGGLGPTEKEARRRAEAKPKKQKVEKETYIQRVMRTAEICRPTKPPLTREQVDPDFKGTNQDWVDQYGHVQIRTKAQMEIDRDQDAFTAWVGGIRSLRVPLREYLAIGKFTVERYHAWMKKASNQEKRLAEIKELASLIVQTRESIDWLLPLLEAKQTNGEHP
jgi:ParB/Sulfiredoxin domain